MEQFASLLHHSDVGLKERELLLSLPAVPTAVSDEKASAVLAPSHDMDLGKSGPLVFVELPEAGNSTQGLIISQVLSHGVLDERGAISCAGFLGSRTMAKNNRHGERL